MKTLKVGDVVVIEDKQSHRYNELAEVIKITKLWSILRVDEYSILSIRNPSSLTKIGML